MRGETKMEGDDAGDDEAERCFVGGVVEAEEEEKK